MIEPATEKRCAFKWRKHAASGVCAAVAAAAPFAGSAVATATTAAGTVDTRLVRSADAVAAVADTRRPEVAPCLNRHISPPEQ